MIVGPPEPDLAVQGSLGFSPASVVGGQQLQFDFTVANIGEFDTKATTYGIYVSLGGAISTSDILLGGGPLRAITAGQTVPVTSEFAVPRTLVSGEYEIGVIVDPSNALGEVNLDDDIGLGKKLVSNTSLGPFIATATCRTPSQRALFGVAHRRRRRRQIRVVAGGRSAAERDGPEQGGDPQRPGGERGQQQLHGQGHRRKWPQRDAVAGSRGRRVQPGADDRHADASGGVDGAALRLSLAAVGGAPPYQWALLPGAGDPPVGINLVSNGTLSGEPQYDQTTTFRVTVTDMAGTVVTSPTYSLTISRGARWRSGRRCCHLRCWASPTRRRCTMPAGTAPYRWNIVDVQREPASPGDPGADFGSNLMSIGLDFDPGARSAAFPRRWECLALEVQLTDSESPAASANGLVLLTVSATTGFSFETIDLPAATANSLYRTTLVTNAPATDTVSFYVVNTAQLPSKRANSTLPPGVQLFSDGLFQGVPLEVGTFPFLVEALDNNGGVATQAFSITVNSDYTPSSGCQSAPGAPAGAGLLLLGLAWVRRRRRTRPIGSARVLATGLVALGVLLAPAALGQVPQHPCGVPPAPITSAIGFQDITTQLGYQMIAAPTSDTMSAYIGGYETDCTVNGNYNLYSEGPWSTPDLAGTIPRSLSRLGSAASTPTAGCTARPSRSMSGPTAFSPSTPR